MSTGAEVLKYLFGHMFPTEGRVEAQFSAFGDFQEDTQLYPDYL